MRNKSLAEKQPWGCGTKEHPPRTQEETVYWHRAKQTLGTPSSKVTRDPRGNETPAVSSQLGKE